MKFQITDFYGFNIEVIIVVGMIGAGMKREVIISMCPPLICNKPAYTMRTFGHAQTPPPPLYAFVCISVDPPIPPRCVHS